MNHDKTVKQMVGKAFMDIADAIETGRYREKIRVGLTTLGSEHGAENLVKGAEAAVRESKDFDVILIGPKINTTLEVVEVQTEGEMHKKMEELLDNGYIQSCVTMHYNFPIGVSTVGRVVTPGMGREMYLTTTTGTSSAHRVEAMVKNAIYGIITAKAMGIEKPTLGILNLDGARQVEKILKDLSKNGYPIYFSESLRSDGGAIMRGNDLLTGTVDVMVTDTLTGNIMMKVFSSYTTGGSYEALGYGYGPGIGEDYKRIILILSRASGIPVVSNALKYAAKLCQGSLVEVIEKEFEKVRAANLDDILREHTKELRLPKNEMEVIAPPKEIITGTITGIDIMDLEEAVKTLWKAGIYAESGMGCTGPIILVHEEKVETGIGILAKSGFAVQEGDVC